jgi:hypothetical protein
MAPIHIFQTDQEHSTYVNLFRNDDEQRKFEEKYGSPEGLFSEPEDFSRTDKEKGQERKELRCEMYGAYSLEDEGRLFQNNQNKKLPAGFADTNTMQMMEGVWLGGIEMAQQIEDMVSHWYGVSKVQVLSYFVRGILTLLGVGLFVQQSFPVWFMNLFLFDLEVAKILTLWHILQHNGCEQLACVLYDILLVPLEKDYVVAHLFSAEYLEDKFPKLQNKYWELLHKPTPLCNLMSSMTVDTFPPSNPAPASIEASMEEVYLLPSELSNNGESQCFLTVTAVSGMREKSDTTFIVQSLSLMVQTLLEGMFSSILFAALALILNRLQQFYDNRTRTLFQGQKLFSSLSATSEYAVPDYHLETVCSGTTSRI